MDQREDYAEIDPTPRRAPVWVGMAIIVAALVVFCLAGIGLLFLFWLLAS